MIGAGFPQMLRKTDAVPAGSTLLEPQNPPDEAANQGGSAAGGR